MGYVYALYASTNTPPAPWEVVTTWTNRFLMFATDSPGSTGGSTYHNHTIQSPSCGTATARYIQSNSTTQTVSYSHTHSISLSSNDGNHTPPYYTLRLIRADLTVWWNNYRTLPENAVVAADRSISWSEYTRLSSADDKYIMISSTPNQTGGSTWHAHLVGGTLSSSDPSTVGVYEESGSNTINYETPASHSHSVAGQPSTSEYNEPPYVKTYLYKVVVQQTTQIPTGTILFFDTTPPTSFTTITEYNNRLLQGGNTAMATGGSTDHGHTLSGNSTNASLDTFSTTYTTVSGSVPNVTALSHYHDVSATLATASATPPYVTLIAAYANTTVYGVQTRTATYNISAYLQAIREQEASLSTRLRGQNDMPHDMSAVVEGECSADVDTTATLCVTDLESEIGIAAHVQRRVSSLHMASVSLAKPSSDYGFSARLIRQVSDNLSVIDAIYRSFVSELAWTYRQLQTLGLSRNIELATGEMLDDVWGRLYGISRLTRHSRVDVNTYSYGRYLKKITVYAEEPAVDFEQKLQIDISDELEGRAIRSDGSDIVFVDEHGNVLPHLIESIDDGIMTVWVQPIFLDEGPNKIRMYFGSMTAYHQQPDEFSEYPEPLEYEIGAVEYVGDIVQTAVRSEDIETEPDDMYRARLKTALKTLVGCGTVRACEEILDTLVGEEGAAEIESRYPATAIVRFRSATAMERAKRMQMQIADILSRAVAVGVTPVVCIPIEQYLMSVHLRGQSWSDFEMQTALVAGKEATASMWAILVNAMNVEIPLQTDIMSVMTMRSGMESLIMLVGNASYQTACRIRSVRAEPTLYTSVLSATRSVGCALAGAVERSIRAEYDLRASLMGRMVRTHTAQAILVHRMTRQLNVDAAVLARGVRGTYRFNAPLQAEAKILRYTSTCIANHWRMPILIHGANEELSEWEQKLVIDFGERYFDVEKCKFVDSHGDELPWMLEGEPSGGIYTFWCKLQRVPAGEVTTVYLMHGDTITAVQSPEEFGEFPEQLDCTCKLPIEAIYI